MFHVELRQFPHNVNRFNLAAADLHALLDPWAREQAVELGDRRWSPHTAHLKVIEGPELALQQLKMGRGWRAAERGGADVTERELAAARERVAAAPATVSASPEPAAPSVPAGGLAAGVELAGLLGADAPRLLAAWSEIAVRAPDLSPSEGLALAERELAAHTDPTASGPAGAG